MIRLQRLERIDSASAPESTLEGPGLDDGWMDYYDLDVDNRRRARRINRQVGIRYRATGEAVTSSIALNLSQTGARVVLQGIKPSFSNELTLEIDRQVDLLARTVWEQPMPGGQCRIAGVTFEAVGPLQKAALDRLLSRIDDRPKPSQARPPARSGMVAKPPAPQPAVVKTVTERPVIYRADSGRPVIQVRQAVLLPE